MNEELAFNSALCTPHSALVVAIVLHLALVANWRIWWGGHCWGSRLLTEVVVLAALLALPAVAALWTRRGGRVPFQASSRRLP